MSTPPATSTHPAQASTAPAQIPSTQRASELDRSSAGAENTESVVERLRKQKRRSSGLGTNVLFFASVLVAFVVGMYAWNKDKPKESGMFGAPPAADPTPSGGIAGRVELGADLGDRALDHSALFLVVHVAGNGGASPLAVRRYAHPQFPLQFEVGASDVMVEGSPFTGPFEVSARLDLDGDAKTTDSADLIAEPVAGIRPGRNDLRLVLGAVSDSSPTPDPTEGRGPSSPQADPTQAPSGTKGSLHGTISVDASLGGAVRQAGTLYVVVRNAGMRQGPPLAVKRYDGPSFPVQYEIGPSDVMMEGVPFEGPFDVDARLDQDGNAATKERGDLETSKPRSSVKPGDGDLDILLDKRRE